MSGKTDTAADDGGAPPPATLVTRIGNAESGPSLRDLILARALETDFRRVVKPLNAARERLGLSGRDLERASGRSHSVVSDLFNEKPNVPTLRTLSAIAAVLGFRVALVPLTPADSSVIRVALTTGRADHPEALADALAAREDAGWVDEDRLAAAATAAASTAMSDHTWDCTTIPSGEHCACGWTGHHHERHQAERVAAAVLAATRPLLQRP